MMDSEVQIAWAVYDEDLRKEFIKNCADDINKKNEELEQLRQKLSTIKEGNSMDQSIIED
jgi:hypothetical protein